MPGNNKDTKVNNSLLICHLNTGPASQFPRDASQSNYGYPIAQHVWTKLEVKNSDFVQACPTAGVPLGPN